MPALSMAALVLVILLNPFSGHLQSVDEVVAYSIANHFDRERKYIVEEGDTKVTLWEESGIVYAMVI